MTLNGQTSRRQVIMKEKTPLSHKIVCFQMLDFGTSKSNSEVSKLILKNFNGKLLLSRKLRYFRGSRFSQCFIL